MNDPALPLGLAHLIAQSDPPALAALAILLLMSVAAWYQILAKTWRGLLGARRSRAFLARFDGLSGDGDTDRALLTEPPAEPFARLALAALQAQTRALRVDGSVRASGRETDRTAAVRILARAIGDETARLESGMTLLASVASAAPFVGLFGTVWGIYGALLAIGRSGQASLDQVAGPVGEALIMTGLGLAVAIPAVLAYNAFNRGNRLLAERLERFAEDLQTAIESHPEGSVRHPGPLAAVPAAATGGSR